MRESLFWIIVAPILLVSGLMASLRHAHDLAAVLFGLSILALLVSIFLRLFEQPSGPLLNKLSFVAIACLGFGLLLLVVGVPWRIYETIKSEAARKAEVERDMAVQDAEIERIKKERGVRHVHIFSHMTSGEHEPNPTPSLLCAAGFPLVLVGAGILIVTLLWQKQWSVSRHEEAGDQLAGVRALLRRWHDDR